MKAVIKLLALTSLAAMASGCAGYMHLSGPGWLHPDDARGHVQADSSCDFGRGANDLGSRCYVSRRPAPSDGH